MKTPTANAIKRWSLLSSAVLAFFFTHALDAANPDDCQVTSSPSSATLSWTTDDDHLSALKKISSLLTKLPVIKTATVTANVSGTISSGEECCPNASTPSTYDEFTGNGTITLNFDFVGAGGKAKFGIDVPVWWGYYIAADLNATAGISGGVNSTGNITASGRKGDCSCAFVSGSLSLTPSVTAEVGAKATGGLFSNSNPLKPKISFSVETPSASATITANFTPNYKKHFGSTCDKSSDGLKIDYQLPQASFDVKIPLPVVKPYTFHFDWDIFATFGVNPTSGTLQ